MRAKKHEGFVLVEVVIAMGLSLIVLLAVGAVLAASHTRWNDAWNRVNLQQDASYVMLRLSRSVKEGTSATVEESGNAVRIYDAEGDWVRFAFVSDTGKIQCQHAGQSPQTVIDGYVEDLDFEVQDNRVGIDLTLKKDDHQVNLISTIQMRNYGL